MTALVVMLREGDSAEQDSIRCLASAWPRPTFGSHASSRFDHATQIQTQSDDRLPL